MMETNHFFISFSYDFFFILAIFFLGRRCFVHQTDVCNLLQVWHCISCQGTKRIGMWYLLKELTSLKEVDAYVGCEDRE